MLQFITHTVDGLEEVLRGGCRWVQLRMKDASDSDFKPAAAEAARLCRLYGATFIIDDRVEAVTEVDADGVHLGKNDMPVSHARKILGDKRIIGATANTFDDIVKASEEGADYIGLGPYRFTTTKKGLSPILGIDGYNAIMEQCRRNGINLPVVAIGGILAPDLPLLKCTGVAGVAISGAILNARDKEMTTKELLEIWKN